MGKFLVRAMSEGLRWFLRLLSHFLTLLTLLAVAVGVFVVGVLLHRAAWLVIGIAVVLIFVVFAQGAYRVWRETDKELKDALEAQREGGEPRNREELRRWLEVRIEEVLVWRKVIDEETAKPAPNIDRTQNIERLFWDGLNQDVSRQLQMLAPKWTDYWGEEPEWFYSPLTRITSEQIAEFGRLLGWVAERLRHIKAELS